MPKLELEETPPVAGEKKESCEDTTGGNFYGGKTRWMAQSFTPLEPYPVGKVTLWLCRNGLPGIVTVGIRNTDGEGHPTGGDLTSGQIAGDLLPETPNFAWVDIKIDPYDLSPDTLYAAVTRSPTAGAINQLLSRRSVNNTCYPRGVALVSTNSGVSFDAQAWDAAFQVWSAEQAGEYLKAGILHVRHPALLAIVHKRGELIVSEYDTLSSLDKEYLTGQVGLDVEAG
ncbi:unnamed protein product, partial [marine sediment metagenome]